MEDQLGTSIIHYLRMAGTGQEELAPSRAETLVSRDMDMDGDHEEKLEPSKDTQRRRRRSSAGHTANPANLSPLPHPTESMDVYNYPTDAAPVDYPEPIRTIDDHHAFAELARHLSVDPPPDGGKEAWLVILGAWLVLFVEFGILTSFGQFQSYYETHQLAHYAKSTISWIGSISTFATFGFSIFAGRAFDSYGPRGLIIGGTTVAVLALVALAFCKEFYQFLLAHALFGLAGAALYTPSSAVCSHWFARRRPTAIGLILCGSGLGGVIFPIVLARLFDQIGFRNAVFVIAGMSAVLFFPAWFTIKARLPPKKATPWSQALLPWKETRYTLFVVGVSLIWFQYFTPFFFANDFSVKQGLNANLANYSVAILNTGSFFGRALSGPLAEFLGAIEVFVASGVVSGIVLLALWTSTAVGVVGTVFGLFLYGLCSGAVIALIAASLAQISEVKSFGLRLGMMWSVASLPLLAGPQLAGVIVAREGGYTGMALFCGFSIVAGSAVTFAPVWVRRGAEWWRHRGGLPEALVVDEEKAGGGVGTGKRVPVASRAGEGAGTPAEEGRAEAG